MSSSIFQKARLAGVALTLGSLIFSLSLSLSARDCHQFRAGAQF